jgi:hypothetical protein
MAKYKSKHSGIVYKTTTIKGKRYLGIYDESAFRLSIDVPLYSVKDMIRYFECKISEYGGWDNKISNDLTNDTYVNKKGLLELDWIDVEAIRKGLNDGTSDAWVQAFEQAILASV